MALSLLYPSVASPDVDVALNIVLVPGIGLLRPNEWRHESEEWLKDVRKPHGERVHIWHYEYQVIKGQAFLNSLLQQSHVLPSILHRLNPRETNPTYLSKSRWVHMETDSTDICKAYANMVEKRHENNNILDHIFGAVYLGTPHIEDANQLDLNIIESIARASDASFNHISFTPEDNQSIAKISRGFSGFAGKVTSTYETVESRYKGTKWKGPFKRSRLVITKDLATIPSTSVAFAELFGVPSTHGNLCKVKIGGELYNAIAGLIAEAVQKYQLSSVPRNATEQSELNTEGSVLDGWDMQSLRSHIGRVMEPISDTLSKHTSESKSQQESDQSHLLQPNSDSKHYSKTPSPSAGYSSQFSYEVDPPSNPIEMDKPKILIPCFSVGSQTRKSPFFGRDDILQSIDESLLPATDHPTVDDGSFPSPGNLKTFALCGAGGIGKTELASEYVFSRRERFSAIFWVTADQRNVLLEDFARVAVELGLQDKNQAQNLAEACELVKGWLCNPVKDLESPLSTSDNEVSWLLVLDNVDNWGVIEDFWPTTGIGSILITSRDPLSRSHIYTAQHGLDLDPLSSTEALDFMGTLSAKSVDGSLQAAKAIVEWAGGLPLIMTAIASTMSSRNLTYNSMLDLLKISGFDAISADNDPQTHSVQNVSIASMIGIACLDQTTKSLIHTISFLNPEGIPQKMLVDDSNRAQLEGFPNSHATLADAQTKLQQASLVTFNESTKTIRMHRIYQDIVRQSLEPEMQVKALSTALGMISKAWVYQPLEHRYDTARYEICSAVSPHVDRIYHHYIEMFKARKIDALEEAAGLFNDVGWYWFERGLPQESKQFCKLAQQICEALQHTKPSEKVAEMLRESHNNQGSAANETNDPQESLQHNLMWLNLMRERRSPDGKSVVDYELGCVYNEVGVAYAMNDMYPLALDFFERSVSTYESLPNYDEKWLGWPLPNIGMVHWVQGNHKEALTALNRMFTIYRPATGNDDGPDNRDDGEPTFKMGKILYGLGNVYLSQGDLERAMKYHSRCLNQWSICLGTNHHRVGDVCHKIAQVLMGEGKFARAQDYINRALRIFGGGQHHKHEYTRTTFLQGQLYFASGKVDLGEQSLKAAHKLRQSLKPQDARPWDELLEADYDQLVIYMSR